MSKQVETKDFLNMDGDMAAAMASYPFIDSAFLYPITPATAMCEIVNRWAAEGKKNLLGVVPETVELQAEGGVAGAMHGALCAGSLAATYTCSQGLLLMVPNMYKMGYEMLPGVIHVASRLVAHHAMNLYCDHSDVIATLPTGFSFLGSGSAQECLDLGTISHVLALRSSIPVMHFFDGLRTSHCIQKVAPIPEEALRRLYPYDDVRRWRAKYSMNPEHPTMRGCGQNMDVYWQLTARTAPNYLAVPDLCEEVMGAFARETGRQYHVVDYEGAPDAEYVILAMTSGARTIEESVKYMCAHEGRKVGVLKLRLWRPFPIKQLLAAIPATCKRLCVLDRVKQVTAAAEPLFLEVLAAVYSSPRASQLDVVGGKFAVGGAEFNPLHVRAVFENLWAPNPMRRFSVGITDDVGGNYLPVPALGPIHTSPSPLPKGTIQALFYGRGSDGTVGSSKAAIALIGSHTNLYTQGYVVFDAKKSGGFTFCHLRFGPEPIMSEYEIYESDYAACHQSSYVNKFEVGRTLKPGSIFVLNSPWTTREQMDKHIPASLRRIIAERGVRFYNIDANALAHELQLGPHINMIMQACFFRLSGVLPFEQALELLKGSVRQMYAKKGQALIDKNIASIDRACALLQPVAVPTEWSALEPEKQKLYGDAFLDDVVVPCARQVAQFQPVSKFPESVARGVFPTNTTRLDKRGVADVVPLWDPTNCVECNLCAAVCPHAALRPFVIETTSDPAPPPGMETKKLMGIKNDPASKKDWLYRLQVSPADCQSCNVCVRECPTKSLRMHPYTDEEVMDTEQKRWDYCISLPSADRLGELLPGPETIRSAQFRQPLLEFHAACAGCSQPTYVKIITQLLGAEVYFANAVGCSMVWGGFTPSSPYAHNAEGHGPVYATSLFEDNAEFGYGIVAAVRSQRAALRQTVQGLLAAAPESPAAKALTPDLSGALRDWLHVSEDMKASKEAGDRIKGLLRRLCGSEDLLPHQHPLASLHDKQDLLAAKSVWIVGGDGWAYDIDFHGLDHVLHSNENVNVVVLDTEVYSNTGGQTSKATPRALASKLTAQGKPTQKKDLGLYAVGIGSCYVASVALGANKGQYIRAVMEAQRYNGPSLILCYCPCIAHDVKGGLELGQLHQKTAVQSGYWPLYRFNPALAQEGKNPLQIDFMPPVSDAPAPARPGTTLRDFIGQELRFTPHTSNPDLEASLAADLDQRNRKLRRMVELYAPVTAPAAAPAPTPAP